MSAPEAIASVVDVFCGLGGLTHGLREAGLAIAAGIDIDEACRFPFETNNHAPFVRKDVSDLDIDDLRELFHPGLPRVLVGCAPCQPFSTYSQREKEDDARWRLVGRFGDLIGAIRPEVVSMENVPRLLDFRGGEVFRAFVDQLDAAEYHVWHGPVYLPDYGLAQKRTRLVVLASRLGPIALPPAPGIFEHPRTVQDAIGHLGPLAAGEVDADDPMHISAGLSPTNMARLRASRPGGSWKDWDGSLVADCHKSESGRTYGSVYGRMRADEPSPTITTQFYGFGSGRFGHPTQDRALSLREGALLQSFPPEYRFLSPGEKPNFKKFGRMIGNAVPVLLGRAIGEAIGDHLRSHAP